VRLAVLYLLSGLLAVLLGTMALRYVVWGAVWLATGAHFWLLPNMMSEEVSWCFVVLYAFQLAAGVSKALSIWYLVYTELPVHSVAKAAAAAATAAMSPLPPGGSCTSGTAAAAHHGAFHPVRPLCRSCNR
jgi:hypothetical protein